MPLKLVNTILRGVDLFHFSHSHMHDYTLTALQKLSMICVISIHS